MQERQWVAAFAGVSGKEGNAVNRLTAPCK